MSQAGEWWKVVFTPEYEHWFRSDRSVRDTTMRSVFYTPDDARAESLGAEGWLTRIARTLLVPVYWHRHDKLLPFDLSIAMRHRWPWRIDVKCRQCLYTPREHFESYILAEHVQRHLADEYFLCCYRPGEHACYLLGAITHDKLIGAILAGTVRLYRQGEHRSHTETPIYADAYSVHWWLLDSPHTWVQRMLTSSSGQLALALWPHAMNGRQR